MGQINCIPARLSSPRHTIFLHTRAFGAEISRTMLLARGRHRGPHAVRKQPEDCLPLAVCEKGWGGKHTHTHTHTHTDKHTQTHTHTHTHTQKKKSFPKPDLSTMASTRDESSARARRVERAIAGASPLRSVCTPGGARSLCERSAWTPPTTARPPWANYGTATAPPTAQPRHSPRRASTAQSLHGHGTATAGTLHCTAGESPPSARSEQPGLRAGGSAALSAAEVRLDRTNMLTCANVISPRPHG